VAWGLEEASFTQEAYGKEEKTMRVSGGGMRQMSLFLPLTYIEGLDKLIEDGYFPNRAEAIRFAILDLLKEKGDFKIRKNSHPNYED